MTEQATSNLQALELFVKGKGWSLCSQKDIDHGYQVIVTDGRVQLRVSFYDTGKIVVQGTPCEMKSVLTDWANLTQAGRNTGSTDGTPPPPNRVAKYLVIPDNIEKIHQVIRELPGEVLEREIGGPAEVYRVEVRYEGHKVTITQYSSGTLMVQGRSSAQFDAVCEALDQHLSQSFVNRATRFIPEEEEPSAVAAYLDKPEAENEATQWLLEQIGRDVLTFLYDNDQRTLLAAAGVRNAFKNERRRMPDYSVVVMPFAKAFEGFLMRLAVHLELTTEDVLSWKADQIEIGAWIEAIKAGLPDVKRYGEIHAALQAAWQCRHKALHSDFAHPLSTLTTFAEADHEVATILRAMARAHRVFVEEGLTLAPGKSTEVGATPTSRREAEYKFEQVDRERLREKLEADGLQVSVQPAGRKNA